MLLSVVLRATMCVMCGDREHAESGRRHLQAARPRLAPVVVQFRKQNIQQILLAGMSANLYTESHMRGLVEQRFEVAVVADATADAKLPGSVPEPFWEAAPAIRVSEKRKEV
jgi:hypothetical protein